MVSKMTKKTLRVRSSGTIFKIEIEGIGKNISLIKGHVSMYEDKNNLIIYTQDYGMIKIPIDCEVKR